MPTYLGNGHVRGLGPASSGKGQCHDPRLQSPVRRRVGAGVRQVDAMLGHARLADEAGPDVVSVGDHRYFADRLDACAALGFAWARPALSPER